MKVLLVAVNAKYIHSNLAVYSLKEYASKYKDNIEICEFTINNLIDNILKGIYNKKPDIIAFSCYIWNIEIILAVSKELKKLLPNSKIWFGGPEVSYNSLELLQKNDFLDGVMIGEGEKTFKELLDFYIEDKILLKHIKGIAYRENKEIYINQDRELINLDEIPFVYNDIEKFKNKIIYYETSRGCPYSCSYCLSSIDKNVRFRSLELVKQELKIFIDNKIPQVKFVDRTFNCNKRHAIEIWKFIKENDKGITNFHFEISADLLSDEEIELISTFREGLIQLEIGVQSINIDTINEINRKMNLEKLSYAVNLISKNKNIHQHLDLIAGLPYEDYNSFKKSFNYVYNLKPQQLQLGFLKVLKGSAIFNQAMKGNIIYKSIPPYEVLYTKWLSYKEILILKSVEEIVEVYYNSGQFKNTMKFLENFFEQPFDLYKSIADFYEQNGLFNINHSRLSRYDIILDYFKSNMYIQDNYIEVFKQILVFDLYLRENLKTRPSFSNDNKDYKQLFKQYYENEQFINKYFSHYIDYNNKQIARLTHIERFTIDILETIRTGKIIKKDILIVFDYMKRNKLTNDASYFIIKNL